MSREGENFFIEHYTICLEPFSCDDDHDGYGDDDHDGDDDGDEGNHGGDLDGTMIVRCFICSAEYMLSKDFLLQSKHVMPKYILFFHILLYKGPSKTAANNIAQSLIDTSLFTACRCLSVLVHQDRFYQHW